jgi:hypothetical protein
MTDNKEVREEMIDLQKSYVRRLTTRIKANQSVDDINKDFLNDIEALYNEKMIKALDDVSEFITSEQKKMLIKDGSVYWDCMKEYNAYSKIQDKINSLKEKESEPEHEHFWVKQLMSAGGIHYECSKCKERKFVEYWN